MKSHRHPRTSTSHTNSREFLFSLTRKDFKMEFFRAGGKGGQNQNKVYSACRIRHPESGAVGESREERDQHQNRRIAFERLAAHPKFQLWLKRKLHEISSGETTDQWVARQEEYARGDYRGGWKVGHSG